MCGTALGRSQSLIHDAVWNLQKEGQAQCCNLSHRQQHLQCLSQSQCNGALNLTIQTNVHSTTALGPLAFKQAILHAASCQPTQTVYSQRALLSGIFLWQTDCMPHLSNQTHERVASSDTSSQHTALSLSAFSTTAVSWTTSGDKRLPDCLTCRRFTRPWGWFILALHKLSSVYISLVLGF